MPSPKTSGAVVILDPAPVFFKSASAVLPQSSAAATQPAAAATAAVLSVPAPVAPASSQATLAPLSTPTSSGPVVATSAASSTTTATITAATTPILTASLQTNGQGSGKQSATPPPPPASPAQLLRGPSPWTASRVEALISSGTIQASWLPDIRAAALTHLQLQNSQQREWVRFSNSIANTGSANWQVRRGTQLSDPSQIAYAMSLGLDPGQLAITGQELLNQNGEVAAVIADAALSEFHPEHKHFHIGETAEFGVDRYNTTTAQWDRITGLEVVKTTFCLIDVNQISPVAGSDPDHYDIVSSPAHQKTYTDCFADVQGVSAGWMDRYNHALPGQEVDITGLVAGTYRIVTEVNPSGWFIESDFSNNVGYTAFELSRDSNGNAKLREIPGATGGIWFTNSSNGMG